MWLLILGCDGPPELVTTDEVLESEPIPGPPNLLLVLLDDVGIDKVSSYVGDLPGYEPVTLPNTQTFDQIGAAGVRFTEAWSNPLCSPTRAGILTGQHAFRHGVGSVVPQGDELSPDAVVLPEVMDGYATGLFGKWHVGVEGVEGDEEPRPEWDVVAEGHTRENPGEIGHSLNPIQQGWDVYIGGLTGTLCTTRLEGGCEGDYDHWLVTEGSQEAPGVTRLWWEERYATQVEVDDALAWIQEQDGPWFAMVALHAPPTPLHKTGLRGCQRTRHTTPFPGRMRMYQGMLECADSHVERLLWTLEEQGRLDNTLLVIAGDNGTEDFLRESIMAADHTEKGNTHDSSIHVPMAISTGESWASVARGGEPVDSALVALPGRTSEQMVHTIDLFATLLDWAGGDFSTGTDALSLAPILAGPSVQLPREFLFTERFWDGDLGVVGFAGIRDVEGNKLSIEVVPREGAMCRHVLLFEDGPVDTLNRYGIEEVADVQAALEQALQVRIDAGADWLDVEDCE